MRDRGQGVQTPLPRKSQKYRISEQYWTGSLKFSKLPSQHSTLDQSAPQRNAIYLDHLSSKKKKRKKTVSELQSWTPSDKTFWIRAWVLIGSSCNKIDWLFRDYKKTSQNKRFVCKPMQSLSTFTTCYQSLRTCSIEKLRRRTYFFITTCDKDSDESAQMCIY